MSCNTKAHAVNFKDNQSFDGHNKIHSKPIVIEGENVTLKNIKLKAISNKPQILIKNSRNVTLKDVSITGNPKQNGIHIQDSEGIILKNINVSQGKDGVYLERVNKLRIENLLSRHNRYGIHFMYVTDAILKNSYFSGNITGIMLMVSEQIEIKDNQIEQQRVLNATGITLYQSKGLSLHHNKLLNNYTAASIQTIKGSKMNDNTFISNLTGLEIIDSQIPIEENTFTNNINIVRMDRAQTKFQKNRYDDLGIIDLNGDGYGDQPKRFSNLLSELMAQDTTLNFFQNSPLHILLKWIEDKSASLDPGFVDEHPRLEKKQTNIRSFPILIILGIIIVYMFRKGLAR
ncbi:right-handed parallel beta-helix repeat-containing protein [Macrococcus animalis]|uniref:right-handed parallel beta-helix repeat-containing protein n=1 Tax=Macrococcus animalis TaxID=3395467 RepID=UPI0039BDFB2E